MVIRGATQQSSAPFNRRIVLDVIRRSGEISRKEIIARVALSPQTVANITQDLESIGLIVAKRIKGEKARGQPPMAFALNPHGGDSIGVSIEPHRVGAALVNLVGEVLDRREHLVRAGDQESALAAIVEMVHALSARSSDARRLWGVGVALPGPFNVPTMSFVGPTALEGWRDLTLLDRLQAACHLPVFYNVDSVAGALGESLFGAARELNTFFYLHFGVGLGGGLIIERSAYRGVHGNATEIGHVPIAPHGKACYCGAQGCLERYVSLHALSEHLDGEGAGELAPGRIEAMIEARDPMLMEWCASAAQCLRNAFGMIENLLDPEAIVIGGPAPRSLVERLVELATPLRASVRGGAKTARVIVSERRMESSILGAAVLPIYEMLSPRFEVMLQERRMRGDVGVLLGARARGRRARS